MNRLIVIKNTDPKGLCGVSTFLMVATCFFSAAVTADENELEGAVKFFVDAKADFNDWTSDPDPDNQEWMRENYYRMQVYSPYFDDRLSWYPNAWDYQNAYGIKNDDPIVNDHPEWILRDASGNMLYIPFSCSEGACRRYAADIGNPDFRAWWINKARAISEKGYIGTWVDDVNFEWRVGDGNGDAVVPMDPRTNKEMTLNDWRQYFAIFLEQFRSELPEITIVHNAIWYATSPANPDANVVRQIDAADYINLERGITDGGIKGGDGKYGFKTFLAFVDYVHSRGANVIMDDDDDSGTQERDYELAVYFLINSGGDLIGSDGDRVRMAPGNFWSGYKTNLGRATGARYRWNTLFRRDFECGIVLVNQPDSSIVTLDLGATYTDLSGAAVTAVKMGSSTGQVLRKVGCVPGSKRPNPPTGL